MARLSKSDLLEVLLHSIHQSGWNALILSDDHPFEIRLYQGENSGPRIRVYIWNITHGGGSARPANEYRIQITGITPHHFLNQPGEKTLILGWWAEGEVFAAWDYQFHQSPLGASPSLQIYEDTLREAYTNRVAAQSKGNEEIAIAFRGEFFVDYVLDIESLHSFGESTDDLAVLREIAEDPSGINDADLSEQVSPKRLITMRTIQRKLRSASFRDRVLTAYGYRCAFSGLQLDLVQAAHILPVSHARGTDATSNGIAASILHHTAYDRGLITFDEQYRVHVNETEIHRLEGINRVGGLDWFRNNLKTLIILPPALPDRPHVEYIRTANRIRGWLL
jgi:putative restriction endonuclease